jgi:hypothetical protein
MQDTVNKPSAIEFSKFNFTHNDELEALAAATGESQPIGKD